MESRESNEAAVVVLDDPLLRRKAAAEMRLDDALAHIQDAQGQIDRAAAALCSVRGMVKEWRQLGALYDKVKSTWYSVSERGAQLRREGRLKLDRDPDAYELRRARGGQ